MTIEDAVRVFAGRNLDVEYQTWDDETNFTIREISELSAERTIYPWECWLSNRGSECIVEPAPYYANDQPLGFVVSSLAEAVSLIIYMYDHRLPKTQPRTLEESKEFTNRLFDKWRKCQR
jgi:hypothetical protein